MPNLQLSQPSGQYCLPESKTLLLLAKERINILEAHPISSAGDAAAFQFQIEFYFDPQTNQKPSWVKTAICATGRDFEDCVEWVIYRVWQMRELYATYLRNPEKVDLGTWE